MKTAKNLFLKIVAFDNLYLAAQKAAKGKREQQNVMAIFMNLEENLWQLREELTRLSKKYEICHCERFPAKQSR